MNSFLAPILRNCHPDGDAATGTETLAQLMQPLLERGGDLCNSAVNSMQSACLAPGPSWIVHADLIVRAIYMKSGWLPRPGECIG